MPSPGIAHQLAPVAAVGLLVVAASAAHAATRTAGDPAGAALTVAVVAFVIAVLVAMKRRTRIECPKARARLTAFLLGGAAWLGTVTAIGMSWSALEVLALMVGALSLNWWRVHRIPTPAQRVAVAVERPSGDTVSHYADRWTEYVGCKGGPLPGTKLVLGSVIDSGVRYTLKLVPGRHERSSVTSVLEKVRGGLGLRIDQDLIIDPHPDLPEPDLMLTVVTTSPIKNDVIWPGPSTFRDGMVDLGPFADGLGVARWRVYVGPRIKGGYMQGGTGSGKSRALEALAIAVAASETHPTVIAYADGQGGASSPVLAEYADMVARTPSEFEAMLDGVMRVKDLRQEENDLEGWVGFRPTAARPGLLIIVDEQHKFTCHPRIQEKMTILAREGEKVGIALIGASQSPLLDAFGGSNQSNNAEAMRSNMLMGNGLVFGSKAKDVKQVFEIDINPSRFPPLPGYCFLVNPLPEARSAPLRGFHFTDEQARVWPTRIAWRELDTAAANAYGLAYRDRKIIAARRMADKRARVEAMRTGQPVPESAEPPITRTVPATSAPLFTVAQFPPFPVWSSVPPAVHPVDAPRVAEIHVRAARAVEEGLAMKGGFTMPRMMAIHLGCSVRWAHDALKALVGHGVLEVRDDAPQGRYYPTGKKLERAA